MMLSSIKARLDDANKMIAWRRSLASCMLVGDSVIRLLIYILLSESQSGVLGFCQSQVTQVQMDYVWAGLGLCLSSSSKNNHRSMIFFRNGLKVGYYS
jgi:hypothetical protein